MLLTNDRNTETYRFRSLATVLFNALESSSGETLQKSERKFDSFQNGLAVEF